jgi:tetratricopeptide (TPR) repeat protein
MTDEKAFETIAADVAAGHYSEVSAKVLSAAESLEDPVEILKYMSLLKTIPDDGTESKVAEIVVRKADASNGREVAAALRNLDCPEHALKVLEGLPSSDPVERLRCRCLFDLEEYESALDNYSKIQNPVINDRILLTSILSSVGEHKDAIETSEALLKENPKDYDVRIAYVSALMMGGKDKEALKYARQGLKDKSADSNAVAAYVLRIQGNYKAAGGYASRAVQIDNGHIGGMETLGICLAMKEEYQKAKIVAGAINEISPGDKAAINILTYCEGH